MAGYKALAVTRHRQETS